MEDDNVIILPADPERVARLRAKLEEYEFRYHSYAPPEPRSSIYYKLNILQRLLKDGQVKAWEMFEALTVDNSDLTAFSAAFDVIEDYCLTGGVNLYGGVLPRAV